jgi:hypothetical protein
MTDMLPDHHKAGHASIPIFLSGNAAKRSAVYELDPRQADCQTPDP